MFDYTIYPDNSQEQFRIVCDKIERAYPRAKKEQLLVDVDGTTIQTYYESNKKINVYDDYDVGAVFVISELDLKSLFQ